MEQGYKVKRSDVRALLAATFPDYSGRRIVLRVARTVTFHDVNWGGGTRNYYRAYCPGNGRVNALPECPPWANPIEGATVDIPAGWCVVQRGFFQGYEYVDIHVSPELAPRMLPAPALTERA